MKNPQRYLFLILLLRVFCLDPTVAQSQVPSISNDITARLTALKASEKNIPESQIELSDELRRIDDELARRRNEAVNYDAITKQLVEAKDSAAKLFQNIEELKCDQVLGTVPEAENLRDIASSILKIIPSNETNPWAAIALGGDPKASPKDQCQGLKNAIGDANKRQALLGFIDGKRQEYEAGKTQLNLLIEALQKRRGELLQHVSAATKVGGDLWLIILVIGLLSVGTIVTIRFFPLDIQVEWVGSGQVIQFVTVMILLTVIMALGLAGILKENTLGTLLGGIGGYVLSQGVGKAAAMAVSRGLATGATAATPLAITALSRIVGPAATPVTITGTGFVPGATVTFGGTPAPAANITNTSIDVQTPAGPAAGTVVEVVVTIPSGQTARLPNAFTYQ